MLGVPTQSVSIRRQRIIAATAIGAFSCVFELLSCHGMSSLQSAHHRGLLDLLGESSATCGER